MTRWARRVAALVGTILFTVPAVSAGAAPSAIAAKTSEKFCAPLTDYFSIHFVAAIAGGFAELGDDKDVDEDVVTATILMGLSPKLVKLTEQMMASAPRILRKGLRLQLNVYRQGVELLKDAGASDKVVAAIANADLDSASESDPTQDLAEKTKLTKKQLQAAGRKFAKIGKKLEKQVGTRAEEAAFDLAFDECGILPDTRVVCPELLTDDEVAAIAGAPVTLDDDQGCSWETADGAGVDPVNLGVDVYAATRKFEDVVDNTTATVDVSGVGDEAVATEGYETSSSSRSCGRTLTVRADERTVQVALCRGEREVTTAELTRIANQVLAKL